MKLEDLRKQGWTIKEIAAETGVSPGDDLQVAQGGSAAAEAGAAR